MKAVTTVATMQSKSLAVSRLEQLAALLKTGNAPDALELTKGALLAAGGREDLTVSEEEMNPKMSQIPTDDFHALIINFDEANAAFNAADLAHQNQEFVLGLDHAIKAIETTKLVATTYAGAIAALRAAASDLDNFANSGLVEHLIKGALAYFNAAEHHLGEELAAIDPIHSGTATDRPPILTPTGRGSYVDAGDVSLDNILFSYDRCPAEFIDQPRDAVIAAYREAQRQIGIAGATPAAAWAPAAPTANSQAALHSLIGQHARLWEIDNEVWGELSDLEDSDAMDALPPIRVQVGRSVIGKNADGEDITTPIYAHSVEAIEGFYRRSLETELLFVRGNDAGTARAHERFAKRVAETVDHLNEIEAECHRIKDACGYTAAKRRADTSCEAVKAVERQILDLEPTDIETVRLKALWVANSYENNLGYIEKHHLLDALKSIGRAAA